MIIDSIDNIEGICIAIGRPDSRQKQQHIGFLFMDEDLEIKFLHLAWHFDLRKESPNKKYLWLDIPLDNLNKIHLATVCASIFRSSQDRSPIPYGICIDGTSFSKDGNFISHEKHGGLTCATFVIQVFHSQDYPIIDFENWEYREEDRNWQIKILSLLKEHIDSDYLNAQYKKCEESIFRFKPEEVAAAATLPSPPHGLKALEKPAQQILDSIIEHTEKMAINEANVAR